MNTYRGYEYGYRNANSVMGTAEGYYFVDAEGTAHGPYASDEKCMDAIDAHRRSLAK